MAKLDFSEYYKPKSNKAPSQNYYEPPKPKSVSKRQSTAPWDTVAPNPPRFNTNQPPAQGVFGVPDIPQASGANTQRGGASPISRWWNSIVGNARQNAFAPVNTWDTVPPSIPVFNTNPASADTGNIWETTARTTPYYNPTSGKPYNDVFGAATNYGAQAGTPYVAPTYLNANRQTDAGVSTPWASNIAQQTAGKPAPIYTQYSQGQYATSRTHPAWNQPKGMPSPQDFFTRMVLNSIGYSVPNQMLNFTDTGGVSADWAQTPRWQEPPAGYTTNSPAWKESIGMPWNTQDQIDDITFEPYSEGGGGYGGYGYGGGGGGSYGASSGVNSYLPGTRAGYGANASSPRYTGGNGARGSSYAGAQSMNQASWRMPMLVWNI